MEGNDAEDWLLGLPIVPIPPPPPNEEDAEMTR